MSSHLDFLLSVACPDPIIPNGYANGSEEYYWPGTWAHFYCDPGFTLVGNTYSICGVGTNLQWDQGIPKCGAYSVMVILAHKARPQCVS